ncbi:cyclopropane-fatty-acyl-phospholipid synthase [mine drainage metagenome]|uniref:Cyclopropane-fatty-acyl-phospholipid synthase n=1 Tax=mine drainage metagenome TaxID=410659 RepID=A0A1J5QML6_9ZZZZ
MLLDKILETLIVAGDLTVICPNGLSRRYGDGDIPNVKSAVVRIRNRMTLQKLAVHPSLALGEAYMDGDLVVEEGGLFNFLSLCLYNIGRARRSGRLGWPDHVSRLFRHRLMHNPLSRSQRNVAHHYDLSGQLYQLFLDDDLQYSCAYFAHPGMSLEEAQNAKKRHLAEKLLLQPGMRVLDIGSGWGGMALFLARHYGVRVTGVTLSEEQLKTARQRVEAEGLTDSVSFELRDYRHVEGRFDRIISVGMFEHVGVGHYPEFFRQIRRLLVEDGVAMLHSIGRSDGPGITNAWIRKYIFPGGYIPSLSEVLPHVENAGIVLTDMEILRIHYALTLKEWRKRFISQWDKVRDLYDETFCRMWDFYLACCEASFLYDNLMVFQVQLAKSIESVPLTRSYITS